MRKSTLVFLVIAFATAAILTSCGNTPYSPWVGDSQKSVEKYFEDNGIEDAEGNKWTEGEVSGGNHLISGTADYFNIGIPCAITVEFDGTDPDHAFYIAVSLADDSSTSDWEKIEEALNSLDRPNSYEKLWDVGDVEVQDNYLESVSFIKKQSE